MHIKCKKHEKGWSAVLYSKGRVKSYIDRCGTQLQAVQKVSETWWIRVSPQDYEENHV